MKSTHRLKLIEILSRQTRLNAEADMQKLRVSASRRDDSSKACKAATDKAADAFEQFQRQSSPGQAMNLDMVRSSASYALDCEKSAQQAQQKLRSAEELVEQHRQAVARQRVRLEKLDDRHRDELQHMASLQMQQQQHEIDEAWLLSNSPGGAES